MWPACGRSGPTADFLRGLIKLAAAGVKVREGAPQGVASHAARAAAIFQKTSQQGGETASIFGLYAGHLLARARAAEALAPTIRSDGDASVQIVFDFVLDPQAIDEV